DMVEHAGERRPRLAAAPALAVRGGGSARAAVRGAAVAACALGRLTVVADDDLADVADLQRRLPLPLVVPDLPAHEIAVERGALPVVGYGVRDVIEPDGLPRRRIFRRG